MKNNNGMEVRRSRRSGATMVEYIMIVLIIAIGLIGAWQMFGNAIKNWLKTIGEEGTGASKY